jgi:hypothetical protein
LLEGFHAAIRQRIGSGRGETDFSDVELLLEKIRQGMLVPEKEINTQRIYGVARAR